MSEPLKARGAKSLANLRRGGPGRKMTTDEDRAARRHVLRMLRDSAYLRNLIGRLRSGKIQPGMETTLWAYAYGRPKETVEVNTPAPIRIVHEYATKESE